ncbi:MAG TPA: ATP-binding protein [Syntrophorhabdaceae bacterium]|nr:ATP-binding protein [Syntrophorhabdaceae bacterium]HQM82857.1 ATP-binding protein [Syntrophorhabdaceae bacterium]
MKKVFARTSNVTAFTSALDRLLNSDEDIPKMALIYGEPGLGKTKAALWWCVQNDGVFIRTKKLMTGRWLLEEIVAELGEAPAHRTPELFRQIQDQLFSRPRTIFIDEVDYLTYDARVIETLRDIHDITGAPVVFIGMAGADKKLMRYRHLHDRFSEIVRFHDLTLDDVRAIADQLCEVKLLADAIQHIYSEAKKFRGIILRLYRAEAKARANGLKEVTKAHLVDKDAVK